mmetsp:Transcript_3472/g.4275  ORF Transcript_3472/g.4275 Transcript_3472/m.4275 type:complete len:626 (+) Transcript_3472:899-2776(+)
MKLLLGYMILSSTVLFFFLGGFIFTVAIQKYRLPIDAFSYFFSLYNFAMVGTIAVFYQKGISTFITRAYLVATSVILSWQLSHFDDWTAWTLLIMLALYDLCAVLTPCGPLKALVNLMSSEDAPAMPGLLYEAQLPTTSTSTQPSQQQLRSISQVQTSTSARSAQPSNNQQTQQTISHAESQSASYDAADATDTNLPSTYSNTSYNTDTSHPKLLPASSSETTATHSTSMSHLPTTPPPTQQRTVTIPLAIAKIYKLPLLTTTTTAPAASTNDNHSSSSPSRSTATSKRKNHFSRRRHSSGVSTSPLLEQISQEEEEEEEDLSASDIDAISQLASRNPVQSERDDLERIKAAMMLEDSDKKEKITVTAEEAIISGSEEIIDVSAAEKETVAATATVDKDQSEVKEEIVAGHEDLVAAKTIAEMDAEAEKEATSTTAFSTEGEIKQQTMEDAASATVDTTATLDSAEEKIAEEEADKGSGDEKLDKAINRLKSRVQSMVVKIESQLEDVESKIGDKLHLLDKDMDGVVTVEEVAASLRTILKRDLTEEQARAIAADMDQNEDGVLTVKELAMWAEINKVIKLMEEGRDAEVDRLLIEKAEKLKALEDENYPEETLAEVKKEKANKS